MLILHRKFWGRLTPEGLFPRSLLNPLLFCSKVVINLEAVILAPKAKAKAREGQRSLGGLVESSQGAGTGLVSALSVNISEGTAWRALH